MKQYIPKSALVAEIERILDNAEEVHNSGYVLLCNHIKKFIDTLETKEVDLEKEIDLAMPSKYCWSGDGEAVYSKEQMRNFAKHFFELGLNASNPLTWKDMMIIHKCIKDAMNYHLYKMMEGMEGQKVVYEEVLKRFKAQKGG